MTFDLGGGSLALLVVALALACAFEFVNGFHDTANAVATVIYTNSLKPHAAVVWSGLCNFLGVFVGGIAVALSIIHLLPFDLLISGGSASGLAMVFALLLAAILWNVGTWYLGLPASSSHTLIGAILGVGIANGLVSGTGIVEGVHWGKALEVALSLLFSPVVGFLLTALLLLLTKRLVHDPRLYEPPPPGQPPPRWIRGTLLVTCTGVSFAHGSNDGQKGVGLIMLILIGLAPATFAINADSTAAELDQARAATTRSLALVRVVSATATDAADAGKLLGAELEKARQLLGAHTGAASMSAAERQRLRRTILRAGEGSKKFARAAGPSLEPAQKRALTEDAATLGRLTEYAPTWVLVVVALSLGIGTMVGWRRIVVTVGERIGKAHLTYAQGAAAELVAMSTIGLSAFVGAPVSTTHVLSSGIAGSMSVTKAGLQMATVKKIGLAWLLTLPASMALAGGLFVVLRWLFQ